MSGCAVCVWDMYQEELDHYLKEKKKRKQQFQNQNQKQDRLEPNEIEEDKDREDIVEMDPSIKAFMELEKKIKQKNQQR